MTENLPPVGVMPPNVWWRKRATELIRAIQRYDDAGMITKQSVARWAIELAAALEYLQGDGNGETQHPHCGEVKSE